MTMKEMQVAVDHLTKGQAVITGKLGLLLVAIGSKQRPTSPPATTTRTPAEPEPFGAAEEPPDAQRQVEHARNLAECLLALEGFNSTPETVSSRTRKIQDVKEAARELTTASGMGDFLLPRNRRFGEKGELNKCRGDRHLEGHHRRNPISGL